MVGCRISAKRQHWYGNEAELWFFQKEGMPAVVVLEGTQNPLVRDQRKIQQRSPWTTATSVFIFCTAAESAAEDSMRPEQLRSSVFFVEVSYEAVCWAWMKPKQKKNWPGGEDKFISMTILAFNFSAVVESVLEGSSGWQQLRRLKKLTLSLTVLKRTERKQSDPASRTLATI